MSLLRRLARSVPVTALLVSLLIGMTPARSADRPERLETPQLIQRAVEAGEIGRATANLYLAYALAAPGNLPARYRSDVPWDATLVALRLQRSLARMKPGGTRQAIERLITPGRTADGSRDIGDHCLISAVPMTDEHFTEHFYIEYNRLTLRGGLTIRDYARSLEGAWRKQVTSFGWAAPPVFRPNPAPGGRYHVRIDELTPVIYGYVANEGSHAGFVGNNPHTPWDDKDAYASCMVLNADFEQFPGTPQQALDATTAHEFNHSIQFGYGALSGANEPDSVFIEGGATWMEDEVYDGSNDNYNYLWPRFSDDMGQYDRSPYPYWITWRGITERYGTGVAGGGEQIMEDFWEITSKNKGSNLQAMQMALAKRNTNLKDAYHAYAIAVKFNRRCGGAYVYPYCFEEGPSYVKAAGPTEPHGTISRIGGSHSGEVPDNYALNWVKLPTGTRPYKVTLRNASGGGQFRGSVACDTGSTLRTVPFPNVVGAWKATTISRFNPSGCLSVVAVVTNQLQTAPNPPESTPRKYAVRTRSV